MQRTRREILNILKRKGKSTLGELATSVGLVPVTVRAHLNVLERDDLVKYEEVRGRVGRPFYVYTLTEEAEEFFPKTYHTLALRLLDSLSSVAGPELTDRVIKEMAKRWAEERAQRMNRLGLRDRVVELARIRTEEGAWAEWEPTVSGFLLTQYNCPVPHVAEQHPDLVCAVELEYIRNLLGASVERIRSRRQGAEACTYLIEEDAA